MTDDRFEAQLRQVVQSSLQKPPEEMLAECLGILVEISGATSGSILAEEGPSLRFLFSLETTLIGRAVPWDSLAGHCANKGVIIYTFAPTDTRHFKGIGTDLARQTRYLLSVPIPSVVRVAGGAQAGRTRCAGCLQLLFQEDIFPAFNVTSEPREFDLEEVRDQEFYARCLRQVMWILPNLALGLEVVNLRQTSYQAIHELKNKLIAAASWINNLKEDLADNAPVALENDAINEDMQFARTAVDEGASLAKNFLEFTKLYTPQFRDTDLNEVLREVSLMVRAFGQASNKGELTVVLELAEGLPTRQLDPSQLKMAFYNLGKNAAEALLEHGAVTPTVTFSSALVDGGLQAVVRDNGKGMPEEIAKHLFVPFKTKKTGGTGLGLTITKKIVDVHGGSIRCATGPTGTIFTVRF